MIKLKSLPMIKEIEPPHPMWHSQTPKDLSVMLLKIKLPETHPTQSSMPKDLSEGNSKKTQSKKT